MNLSSIRKSILFCVFRGPSYSHFVTSPCTPIQNYYVYALPKQCIKIVLLTPTRVAHWKGVFWKSFNIWTCAVEIPKFYLKSMMEWLSIYIHFLEKWMKEKSFKYTLGLKLFVYNGSKLVRHKFMTYGIILFTFINWLVNHLWILIC